MRRQTLHLEVLQLALRCQQLAGPGRGCPGSSKLCLLLLCHQPCMQQNALHMCILPCEPGPGRAPARLAGSAAGQPACAAHAMYNVAENESRRALKCTGSRNLRQALPHALGGAGQRQGHAAAHGEGGPNATGMPGFPGSSPASICSALHALAALLRHPCLDPASRPGRREQSCRRCYGRPLHSGLLRRETGRRWTAMQPQPSSASGAGQWTAGCALPALPAGRAF